MKQGYPGQPSLDMPSSLFTDSDRRSAAAHERHISAGVQETPDHDTEGDHLSEQQKKWLRSMERADAARDEIKNLPVDVILQNCDLKLAQSGRRDLVLQITYKELVMGHIPTKTTAAKYASEQERLTLHAKAKEYIMKIQNPAPVERAQPIGHVAAAAALNPWNPRGDFGGK